MPPTDCHYLFAVPEEMQFPSTGCAQGEFIYMCGKSSSSGVESMSKVNVEICQKMAVDILNSAIILLKKESTRFEKSGLNTWKHLQPLTPKGIIEMEEAFKNINTALYRFHVMEMENHHTATVSKKSASEREYTVIIHRDKNMGLRCGMCTCGFPEKEGIPCKHMVALVKVGAINGLTRIGIMPHWHTTSQGNNQFSEDATFDTHVTLKSIKASSTPQDNIQYCHRWATPQKKGAKKKRRAKKTITPEEVTVDLEGKDVKNGQEGTA